MQTTLIINEQTIKSDQNIIIDLPLPALYTNTPLTMPVHVVTGTHSGPRLFVGAAIHGDELNGVEIIRRLLKNPSLKHLHGDLIAVPMINVYGIIHHSRYLPDRRDLNRSFPGSNKGSLTQRIANLLMTEIIDKCSHGIDLHTAAIHRNNLPQIRANLDDPETLSLAKAFNVPVLINANTRDGSLRGAATAKGIPILLYEAGEALRFDEVSIRAGVRGILNVMTQLGMLPHRESPVGKIKEPVVARSSHWVRSPASGLFRAAKPLGARLKQNEVLGVINDPINNEDVEVVTSSSGLVIGRTEIPLVYEGEALYHIARFDNHHDIAKKVVSFREAMLPDEEQYHPDDYSIYD